MTSLYFRGAVNTRAAQREIPRKERTWTFHGIDQWHHKWAGHWYTLSSGKSAMRHQAVRHHTVIHWICQCARNWPVLANLQNALLVSRFSSTYASLPTATGLPCSWLRAVEIVAVWWLNFLTSPLNVYSRTHWWLPRSARSFLHCHLVRHRFIAARWI